MYAVVETGGKQYKVEKGTSLLVDRLSAKEGDKVSLRAVMFRDREVVAEPKELEKVKVEATVAEHLRGPKIKVFKYKPKKGYRRRAGHRSELTRLEVTEIRMGARKAGRESGEKARRQKGSRRWLIRRGSAPAATGATPTPRCSGSRSSPGRRSAAARSSSASAAPASGRARAPASAATTRSSRRRGDGAVQTGPQGPHDLGRSGLARGARLPSRAGTLAPVAASSPGGRLAGGDGTRALRQRRAPRVSGPREGTSLGRDRPLRFASPAATVNPYGALGPHIASSRLALRPMYDRAKIWVEGGAGGNGCVELPAGGACAEGRARRGRWRARRGRGARLRSVAARSGGAAREQALPGRARTAWRGVEPAWGARRGPGDPGAAGHPGDRGRRQPRSTWSRPGSGPSSPTGGAAGTGTSASPPRPGRRRASPRRGPAGRRAGSSCG